MKAYNLRVLNRNLRELEQRAAKLRAALCVTTDIVSQQNGFLELQRTNARLAQIRNTVDRHNEGQRQALNEYVNKWGEL